MADELMLVALLWVSVVNMLLFIAFGVIPKLRHPQENSTPKTAASIPPPPQITQQVTSNQKNKKGTTDPFYTNKQYLKTESEVKTNE
jgi:hypothetical protein